MPIAFERLRTVTLRDRIAGEVRAAVLNGSLPEGSRIVERNLAAQFQTSLTAVREALVRLEAEGFVTKRPNAATHVTKLTLAGVEQIFDVRRVLETFAVEQAASVATTEQRKELEAAFLELMDVARSGNAQKFILGDCALHELIWSMTGNDYLLAALKRATPAVFAFAAIRTGRSAAFDLTQDANSHGPLIEAIVKGDPAAARERFLAALEVWLDDTRKYISDAKESLS